MAPAGQCPEQIAVRPFQERGVDDDAAAAVQGGLRALREPQVGAVNRCGSIVALADARGALMRRCHAREPLALEIRADAQGADFRNQPFAEPGFSGARDAMHDDECRRSFIHEAHGGRQPLRQARLERRTLAGGRSVGAQRIHLGAHQGEVRA